MTNQYGGRSGVAGHASSSRGRNWLISVLMLAIAFVALNIKLVNGKGAPLWDADTFFAPAFTLIADHARVGRIALWNPWQSGGYPEYADPEVGAASPVLVLVGAITGGTEAGFRVYWLLFWFFGALGMVVLAWHIGAPPWAGFVIALGFAFSGFFTGHAEHTATIYSASFLPWFLWRFDVALLSARIKPAIEAGALWGLSALGGYPELTILSGGFLFLWALGRMFCVRSGGRLSSGTSRPEGVKVKLSSATLSLVLVVVVGVPVLAPSYYAFFTEGATGYSDRVVRSREEAIGSDLMEPGAMVTFASPYLSILKFYNPNLWPGSDISLISVYMGALIIVLALLAILIRPKSSWRWWLAAIIALSLMCAVGKHLPLRGWLYDYFIPARYFRTAALFRLYAMFSAAILALHCATDFEDHINDIKAGIWKLFLWASLFSASGAFAAYLYTTHAVKDVGNQIRFANMQLACVWLGVIALSLLLFLPRFRRLLPILFVAFALFDASLTMRIANRTIFSTGERRQIWNRINVDHDPTLDLTANGFKRDEQPAEWMGSPPNNENVPLKMPTLFNYETMTNRIHLDFERHPILVDMSTGSERMWFANDAVVVPPTSNFYDAFVGRVEALSAPVLVVHSPRDMARVRDLSLTSPKGESGLKGVSLLPRAEPISARLLRYVPNELNFQVVCPSDGWLLVTDRWARGWKAWVNGRETELFGGDFLFRAVQVQAGNNTIRLEYHPGGWPALFIVSWGTLFLVFGNCAIAGIQKYRQSFAGVLNSK